MPLKGDRWMIDFYNEYYELDSCMLLTWSTGKYKAVPVEYPPRDT
jgi:hypothetical protein